MPEFSVRLNDADVGRPYFLRRIVLYGGNEVRPWLEVRVFEPRPVVEAKGESDGR